MAASHGFDASGTGATEAKAGVYQRGGAKANKGAALSLPACGEGGRREATAGWEGLGESS